MPSLLDQINQAPRPAVSLYSPGRLVPGSAARARAIPLSTQDRIAAMMASRRPRPMPTNSAQAQLHQGPSPWDGFAEEVMSSPAYKPTRDAMEQAQLASQADLPWWKQGLGMVFGNPIVKTALRPIEAMSMIPRTVVLGVEELSKALGTATDKSRADKRSNWAKVTD